MDPETKLGVLVEKDVLFLLDESKEIGDHFESLGEEERVRLDRNLHLAMDNIPEAFTRQAMLYVRVFINGRETIAFVDTGAQISLMSLNTAVNCGLNSLIDTRFRLCQRGIGGISESIGRIMYCPVVIGGHNFPASFVVVDDNVTEEVILGLDFLKKHGAVINLKKETMSLMDSVAISFLPEAEAEQRRQFG